jgi:signal recognition particle receptor subunit beta
MVENISVKSFANEDGSKANKSIQLVDLPGHERLRVAGLLVSLKN